MRTKTKAAIGAETAKGIFTDPEIRSAAAEAAPPVARLGLGIGRRVARRRTRKQLEQIGDTVKRHKTVPLVAGGVVASATTAYVVRSKLRS
jgi:hypothetical protein